MALFLALLSLSACKGWDDDAEYAPQYRGTALLVQDSTGRNRVDYWTPDGYAPDILAAYTQGSIGGMVLVPNAGLLYASDPDGRQIIVFNLKNNTLLQRFPIDGQPGALALCSRSLAVALQDQPAILWLDIQEAINGSKTPRVDATQVQRSALPASASQLIARNTKLYAADGPTIWVLSETARMHTNTLTLAGPVQRLSLDGTLRLVVLTPDSLGSRITRYEPNGDVAVNSQVNRYQDALPSPYNTIRWGSEYLNSVERTDTRLNQSALPFAVGSFGVDFQGGWLYAAHASRLGIVRYNLNTKNPETVLETNTVQGLYIISIAAYYDTKR